MGVEIDAIMALCEHPNLVDGCDLCLFRLDAAAEHVHALIETIEQTMRDLKSNP